MKLGFLNLKYMPYHPNLSALEWARDIVNEHSDYNFIVSTHAYIGYALRELGRDPKIWDNFLRNHKNILLVLGGHTKSPQEASYIKDGINGNVVCEILSNYQTSQNGGDGFLRYYTFVPSEGKIEAHTYSPYTREYSTQFTMKYNLTEPIKCSLGPEAEAKRVIETPLEKLEVIKYEEKSANKWSLFFYYFLILLLIFLIFVWIKIILLAKKDNHFFNKKSFK